MTHQSCTFLCIVLNTPAFAPREVLHLLPPLPPSFLDGINFRSGAEVALEYFPDSLLSNPADLNATYLETGHLISDNEAQGLFSPLPPLAPADKNDSETAAKGALERGRGGFGRSWLGRNNGGGASSPSPLKTASPSEGRRGLLRRLLSRSKLRRKPPASSLRSAAPAPAPAEAVVTGDAGSVSAAAAAAAAEPTQ